MSQIASSQEAGLERLYDRYSSDLYALCLRILHNPCDAQGVVLDIFWEIWSTPERFDPTRGTARTYLVTLARSRAIDQLRANKRRKTHDQATQEERSRGFADKLLDGEPLQHSIELENGRLVTEALETLTRGQRETLELSFFDGLTHREIAERLEMPLGSVKTNIRQGLIKLRKVLRKADPEWETP